MILKVGIYMLLSVSSGEVGGHSSRTTLSFFSVQFLFEAVERSEVRKSFLNEGPLIVTPKQLSMLRRKLSAFRSQLPTLRQKLPPNLHPLVRLEVQ